MIWKDIIGFEGLYQVSENGDVRSLARNIASKRHPSGAKRIRERIMRPHQFGKYGHLAVDLVKNGVRHRRAVHHLVARAYLGEAPEGTECIRHLDDDPTNNRYQNLAYGTSAENVADSIRAGTFALGERNGMAKLTNLQAAQIKAGLQGGERNGVLARKYNVSPQTISDIKAGRKWAHIPPKSEGAF